MCSSIWRTKLLDGEPEAFLDPRYACEDVVYFF